jgi:hypothetical protein
MRRGDALPDPPGAQPHESAGVQVFAQGVLREDAHAGAAQQEAEHGGPGVGFGAHEGRDVFPRAAGAEEAQGRGRDERVADPWGGGEVAGPCDLAEGVGEGGGGDDRLAEHGESAEDQRGGFRGAEADREVDPGGEHVALRVLGEDLDADLRVGGDEAGDHGADEGGAEVVGGAGVDAAAGGARAATSVAGCAHELAAGRVLARCGGGQHLFAAVGGIHHRSLL